MKMLWASAAAGVLLAGTLSASATTVNLITAPTEVSLGDAIFRTTDIQPTGTGVIDPFLRVQGNGVVQGYNTDAGNNALDNNNKDILAGYTNSVKLSTLSKTTINTVDYYGFLLDINQENSDPLLTLNEIKIYQTSTGTPTGYNGTTFTGDSSAYLAYDLGAGNSVELNYLLNPGSGAGDMLLFVKASNFTSSNEYITLFSKFGDPNKDNDGFEEWAAFTSTTNKPPGGDPDLTPLPSAALSGMSLLGCLGIARRRSR